MHDVQGHARRPVVAALVGIARKPPRAYRRAQLVGRGLPWGVAVGKGVSITGTGVLRVGRGVVLGDGTWLHVEAGAEMIIGSGTSIGRWCVLSTNRRLDIGPRVLFGPHVLIQDHLHGSPDEPLAIMDQPLIPRGSVRIEEGAWLGSFVAVVPGRADVVIGSNAVLGAGSVVTKSVASRGVVLGHRGLRERSALQAAADGPAE